MKEKIRLNDIAIHSKGKQIKGTDLIKDGKYDYLNGGINPSGKWNDYNTEGNTVTISEGGNSSGYVNYMVDPFWCGAHCYYLSDIKGNSKYLYYALKSKQEQIMHLRTGATMPNLKKSVLGEFIFTYDKSDEEQEKVVQILEKLEMIIENRKTQINELDVLIKSRFVEMFGDPIVNDKQFESILGENVYKLSNGKTVPAKKRKNSGIPAYGGNGISWYTDEILFDTDTVVVGRVGFQSGNVHLVKGPLWITDNAMYISKIIDVEYKMEFLFALMEHIDFSRFQDAGDLKKVTQKPFMQMKYIKPPITLQEEYLQFSVQVDKLKVEVQNSLDETQILFDSLMQKYFD